MACGNPWCIVCPDSWQKVDPEGLKREFGRKFGRSFSDEAKVDAP